jgi:hypothetical protein
MFLPHLILALAPVLSLLPSVAAHGYVTQVTIDGTSYSGNVPNAQPSDSPIRQISTIDPVKGANNTNLNCGQNAQLASMVVSANPGSVMDFYWGDPGNENVSYVRPFFEGFLVDQRRARLSRYSGPIIPVHL